LENSSSVVPTASIAGEDDLKLTSVPARYLAPFSIGGGGTAQVPHVFGVFPSYQIHTWSLPANAALGDDKSVFFIAISDRSFRPAGSFNSAMWNSARVDVGIQRPAFEFRAKVLQPWWSGSFLDAGRLCLRRGHQRDGPELRRPAMSVTLTSRRLDHDRQPVWAKGVAISRTAAPNIGQLKAVGST
jgi:hypothetical protein